MNDLTVQERIHDKNFELYFDREHIKQAVQEVASSVAKDYLDKNPVFISMLNGAFVFTADFLRHFPASCEVIFVKYSSYEGTNSTGVIREELPIKGDLTGRHLVVLEDIVDTGKTLAHLLPKLQALNPASLKIASFLFKPEAFKEQFSVDYVGIEIPNVFVVGYGLDYDGLGRNLPCLYKLSESGHS